MQKKKKKSNRIFAFGIFICCFISFLNTYKDFKGDFLKSTVGDKVLVQSNEISLEEVILKRVVDGDTLIVTNSDGEDVRVRLIGIDTSESVHPDESKNTLDGDIASEYTKSLLEVGQILYLEYDVEQMDVYNRTLAYVWLTNYDVDSNNIESISNHMLNAKLVADGYAVAKRFAPNVKYAEIFENLEK
ncbi:thermonuclease family protein [Turicibacter sp. GALT-G1]|uniref:thermonuclease family protein n=1 Tax=Turicibacter sp. GALT-G1 TaxID=2951140 RepID=UPI0021D49A82|nr:thermonuclease family protein [Turicibacter sp. GALT-G1]MCU7207700.1 thermonuclease family protein [Turicibacter sp. GALT-G1]